MAAARERLGLPADALLITFVGRIQPLKAPDVMLRAVALLLERRPELRATLHRRGRRRPVRLRARAAGLPGAPGGELGLGDVVRFVPPVAQAGLVDWYAASSLVCVPSYNESFGLVAVEAQASGTPVVAAAVGGLTTAVADGRLGPARARPRARVVRRRRSSGCCSTRACASGSRSGALAHAAQFGWDRTAAAMIEVYAKAQEKMRADLTGVAL